MHDLFLRFRPKEIQGICITGSFRRIIQINPIDFLKPQPTFPKSVKESVTSRVKGCSVLRKPNLTLFIFRASMLFDSPFR